MKNLTSRWLCPVVLAFGCLPVAFGSRRHALQLLGGEGTITLDRGEIKVQISASRCFVWAKID